ncbi:hypothetical protein ACFSTJ_19245 [Ottowia pentelensis]|uniref:hypothetical protein n=1 Tax=Ottowia pentelensis TaxID=511108 RepID=UPI00362A3C9A
MARSISARMARTVCEVPGLGAAAARSATRSPAVAMGSASGTRPGTTSVTFTAAPLACAAWRARRACSRSFSAAASCRSARPARIANR